MQPLTPKQIEWVYGKCAQLCIKYTQTVEKTMYDWKMLDDELRKLEKASKQAKDLMVPLLVQTVNYIDKISTEQMKLKDIT